MVAQTAGEQKYSDFIQERAKTVRMGMIVWASLLAVAFIASLSNIKVGILLGIVGAALAFLNVRSQHALKSKLDGIEDKQEFYNQLAAPDVLELKEYQLLIAKDYVLKIKGDVFVYSIADMGKVEVGVQKEGHMSQKTLFLTDKKGVRHEIASCGRDGDENGGFDRAYQLLNEKF